MPQLTFGRLHDSGDCLIIKPYDRAELDVIAHQIYEVSWLMLLAALTEVLGVNNNC